MSKKLKNFLTQVNKKQIVEKRKSISIAKQYKKQLTACLEVVDPDRDPTQGPLLGVMIRALDDSVRRMESELKKLESQKNKLRSLKGA